MVSRFIYFLYLTQSIVDRQAVWTMEMKDPGEILMHKVGEGRPVIPVQCLVIGYLTRVLRCVVNPWTMRQTKVDDVRLFVPSEPSVSDLYRFGVLPSWDPGA